MDQIELSLEAVEESSSAKKSSGPPNRMNDLAYKDWMKFQKSFFRYSAYGTLVEECITFFTKTKWPDGSTSRSLVIGSEHFTPSIDTQRTIKIDYQDEISNLIDGLAQEQDKYDFVLVDLRKLINNNEQLIDFLNNWAEAFFLKLRESLVPSRYCALLVGTGGSGGLGFPIPWSIALASRNQMKLRDEKICLNEATSNCFYCLFLQAEKDERVAEKFSPESIIVASSSPKVPTWIIPKPPPRRKNEILHPAKYPETLVSDFIELFTKPGDWVMDPMAGTGSTIIAAIRSKRRAFGVELNPEYVEISNKRIAFETQPALGDGFSEQVDAFTVQGDATKLNEIKAISNVKPQYAITSPPYWSMLSNPGSENQRARRNKNLPLVYSNAENDLGNVSDYPAFLDLLCKVYDDLSLVLAPNAYLTVVVKNVKRNHTIYPLAWDLVSRLCSTGGKYEYVGNTFWCQDDVGLKPFAVGIHWVSNTLHQYCMHFRKRT